MPYKVIYMYAHKYDRESNPGSKQAKYCMYRESTWENEQKTRRRAETKREKDACTCIYNFEINIILELMLHNTQIHTLFIASANETDINAMQFESIYIDAHNMRYEGKKEGEKEWERDIKQFLIPTAPYDFSDILKRTLWHLIYKFTSFFILFFFWNLCAICGRHWHILSLTFAELYPFPSTNFSFSLSPSFSL